MLLTLLTTNDGWPNEGMDGRMDRQLFSSFSRSFSLSLSISLSLALSRYTCLTLYISTSLSRSLSLAFSVSLSRPLSITNPLCLYCSPQSLKLFLLCLSLFPSSSFLFLYLAMHPTYHNSSRLHLSTRTLIFST